MMGTTISYKDNLHERLKNPQYAGSYLRSILEEGNAADLEHALKEISAANGWDIPEGATKTISEILSYLGKSAPQVHS